MMYIRIAAAALLAAAIFTSFYMYGEVKEREQLLNEANAALAVVGQAKQTSETAQAELTEKIDKLNVQSEEVIIQTNKAPVTADEGCMSDVLKGVLDEK